MSFFYPNEMQTIKQKLELKYPINEITQRHIEKKFYGIVNSNRKNNQPIEPEGELITESSTYYQINLTNTKHNLIYEPLLPSHFTARHIYLYGLLHNNITNFSDNNKSIVGELVIEHRPKTAVNQKIFTCYLLEFQDNEPNNLDNLIQSIDNENNQDEPVKFNMNKIIKNQEKVIYYESDYDHVFVFMKTIPVNSATKDFLSTLTHKTNLFTTSAPYQASIVSLKDDPPSQNINDPQQLSQTNTNTQETFIGSIFGNKIKEGNENINDDNMYIECDLVNADDETETAVIKDSKDEQKIHIMQIFMYFLSFIIILLLSYSFVPKFYQYAILINVFNDAIKEHTNADNKFYKKFFEKLRLIDIVLFWLFLGYAVAFLLVGFTNSTFTILGMIFLIGTFFSYGLIQNKKEDPDFMTFYREFNGKIQEIICSFDKKPNDEDMEVGSSLLYSFLYIVKPINVAHICFYGETKEDKFWNLLKTILIIIVFMSVFAFFMSLIRFKQSISSYFWAAFFFCYMIFIPFYMRYTNESGKEYNKYREEFFEKKNVKQ